MLYYFKPALHLTVILFFTAYVMSSGPRYIREYKRKVQRLEKTTAPSFKQAMTDSFIRPYRKLWQSWKPVIEQGLVLIRVQHSHPTEI